MCPKNGGQYNLMCPKNGGQYIMGYSRDIHGVFVGYTYVSGMCRVCIGNVSGTYRKEQGASGFFDGLIKKNRGVLFKFRAGVSTD